jgi:hypothetical protein
MIRTKTKNNYLKIIEVYEYYIRRENVDPVKVEGLMSDWDAVMVFGSYSSLRRCVNKLKKKIPIGKKNFDKQKQVLEIYEQKLANK